VQNNLLRKFLVFSYGSVVSLFVGFLGTMITTRILSPDDFGKASMFTLALNVFMIVISFGTDQAFIRFFYEEEEERRPGLLYTCLKIPLTMSLLGLLLLVTLQENVTTFLFGENSVALTVMLGLGIMAQIVYRFSILVIRMKQRANLFSLLEIANRLLNIALIVIFYKYFGADYYIIIYATVTTLVLLTLVAIYCERRFWSFNNITLRNLKHRKLDVLKYGSPLVITLLTTWLFQSFDKIAIRQWSSYEELGLYAAAFKIVGLLNVSKIAFSNFWTPVSYESFEKNPDNKLFFESVTKIVSLVMFLLAVLSIAGKDIMVIILGNEFREASNIVPLLVFMPIMYTLSETTVIGINFYKEPKWHILIGVSACLVNVVGNWLLVPVIGAIGAALSTAFSYIVFFTLRTVISLRYYKVDYDLSRLYLILVSVFVYAIVSVGVLDFYWNIIVGLMFIFLLMSTYKDEWIPVVRKASNKAKLLKSESKINSVK
jgi:O-antigen/teichoic acid export membrane protein